VDASDVENVLTRATVPEHSAAFMEAMSGGKAFLSGPYLFVAAKDWLLAVGYPLFGEDSPPSFDEALAEAVRRTRATKCWAICPSLPARLRTHCTDRDTYYTLPSDVAVPGRLERQSAQAARALRVEEGTLFTAAHRRLWAEFLSRVPLPPNVRELFARAEQVLSKAPGLVLLNAWDEHGHLAACLLLDTAPQRFLSYLIGAHSRTHYTPHASDLLFREMIQLARRQHKAFVHLGLGVNNGVRRFKTKWGGTPFEPYEMAAWEEKPSARADVNEFMRVMASMSGESMSKRQFFASLPPQRRFAMLWEIEKNERRSWIGGTAHFFCHSFEYSFRELFERVDTVLFEGPLDQASLDEVAEVGKNPAAGSPRLIDALTEEEIRRLERVVCGPQGFWARLLGFNFKDAPDVRHFLAETRPWMAFFSLWTSCLERHDWRYSVDLEAWHLAHEMGKAVRGMETIAEQLETLESIPLPRILNFLRHCGRWRGFLRRNARAYLRGDLERLMGTSIEFPTRTERVISDRDTTFLTRMRPFLEEGRCAVLVGSAHLLDLRQMIAQAGFTIRRSR
jgi:uncharacterized protein YbaP (TraB family)